MIHVAPLTESGDCGSVDLFVELCAAVVLDTIFDGGDDEDEEDRKGGGGCRGGSKDGKDCDVLDMEWVGRAALTLENDEGQKVIVGYTGRRGQ